MKRGNLETIRWQPFPANVHLSLEAGSNAVVRAFLQTGVPRPPQSMSVLDEARFFLRCAAEIEHGLLIQYLYALYSLDVSQPVVGKWASVLREIAVEEMGHLLTVQNLLLAIGAAPYFDRQHLATDPFPFQLEPMSRSALAKYVTTESPGVENISDLSRRGRVAAIEAIAVQAAQNTLPDGSPEDKPPLTIKHVGIMYAWLYWLFLPSDKNTGPWHDLRGEPFLSNRHLRQSEFTGLSAVNQRRQALPEDDDWGLAGAADGPVFVRPVNSAEPMSAKVGTSTALETIFKIAVQGEGFVNTDDSHFERFLRMFDELEDLVSKGTAVSRPLAIAPSVDPLRPGRTITHPVAAIWARLFNARYEMLLLKLSLAMSQDRAKPNPKEPAGRPQLIRDAVNREMLATMLPIADKLAQLPLKPRPPHATVLEFAGPTFELPDEPLPTNQVDITQRLIELIDVSAQLVDELRKMIPGKGYATGPDPDLPSLTDDERILQPLETADAILRPALVKFDPARNR